MWVVCTGRLDLVSKVHCACSSLAFRSASFDNNWAPSFGSHTWFTVVTAPCGQVFTRVLRKLPTDSSGGI